MVYLPWWYYFQAGIYFQEAIIFTITLAFVSAIQKHGAQEASLKSALRPELDIE